jgi:hypothetical protein
VKAEIANAINALYPDLFTVAKDESITFTPAKATYGLPASAEGVVSVSVQTLGPSGMWRPVYRYRYDALADTSSYPTGRSIDIYEGCPPGRTLKVLYKKRPTVPTADSDLLSDNGISDGWRDLIRLKATSQLLLGLEPIRLNVESIESLARGEASQPAQATTVVRALLQQYQVRLSDEIRTLYRLYPSSVVRMN